MKSLIPFILLTALAFCSQGQTRKKNSSFNRVSDRKNTFLHKQWWIGIKGGANYSDVQVDKSYTVITPTNYNSSDVKKKYQRFTPAGAHVTLEATFYYRGFSISVQPGYQHTGFRYDNRFSWTDPEESSLNVSLTYEQEHRLEYITLPMLVRYEIPLNGFSPYVQGGFYSNILLNASKQLTVFGKDESAGGPNDFESEPVAVGATDLFAKYHYGVLAGAGVYYSLGNIRLNLDIQYRVGLSLVNSPANRFGNDRLSGIGDAMDDIRLNNAAVSIGALFPLRFLSSGFKSHDNL